MPELPPPASYAVADQAFSDALARISSVENLVRVVRREGKDIIGDSASMTYVTVMYALLQDPERLQMDKVLEMLVALAVERVVPAPDLPVI